MIGVMGENRGGGISDTMGVRRKMAAEEFRTRWASGGKWQRKILDARVS